MKFIANHIFLGIWERPGTNDKIPLRVYAPFDKIAAGQADHAMQVQEFVMAHYEEEFGIVYPLPKLDLIAIPDFVTGRYPRTRTRES